MKNNLEEEIEKTLNSLDNLKRVEVPFLFYKKVQDRIVAESNIGEYSSGYSAKSIFAMAALLIGVLLNVFTITKIMDNKQSTLSESLSAQTFAKDYDLNIYTAYDTKTGD